MESAFSRNCISKSDTFAANEGLFFSIFPESLELQSQLRCHNYFSYFSSCRQNGWALVGTTFHATFTGHMLQCINFIIPIPKKKSQKKTHFIFSQLRKYLRGRFLKCTHIRKLFASLPPFCPFFLESLKIRDEEKLNEILHSVKKSPQKWPLYWNVRAWFYKLCLMIEKNQPKTKVRLKPLEKYFFGKISHCVLLQFREGTTIQFE